MRDTTLTRRQAFAAATALGAGALAATTLGLPRPALAQQSGAAAADLPPVPPVHRFDIGGMRLVTVRDGAVVVDGPHPIFGQNVDAETVRALAVENFLPPERMEIAFTPTLLDTGSELVLFDAGNGAGRRPDAGHARERLEAAGIAPGDVDVVAITHFHPDHIGGLMEDGAPAFPNARYVMPKAEHDFWSPPEKAEAEATARVGQLVQSNVLPLADRTTLVGDGDEVVPGVTAMATHGHTPGHTSYMIGAGADRVLVLGDVANHFVASVQRPDWHVRFDMDKEAAAETRRRVLGMLADERIPFVGYHMPTPGLGYVERAGEGFRFVPVTYQFRVAG